MRKGIVSVITVLMLLSLTGGCIAEIRTPPPAARIEVRPSPHFPDAVWIDGHWQHRHGGWVWTEGYWDRRPRPGAHWVPGYWDETPRGWRWVPGHWK